MACPALNDSAFLGSVLAHVDCQAQAIGAGGYQALGGSGPSLFVTGALTIFVALFGLRMVLGETPGAREGVLAMVKLGVVLVLATSWPAFRTLTYDVTLRGPAELAARIGQPADLPGAGGGLVARLQMIDAQLAEYNELGAGRPPTADVTVGPTQTLSPQQQQQEMQRLAQLQDRPRYDPARNVKLLGQARTVYLTATIAAFASVRLIAGLLLALGPLFVLFLLFDATRGLFEGWVRGLAGAALGALATGIILGVELALVEPWLAGLLFERRSGIATPAAPVELLVVTLVFALTLLAALIASARVARGFRFPEPLRAMPARIASTILPEAPLIPAPRLAAETQHGRERAMAIADAIATTQRREQAAAPAQYAVLGNAPNSRIRGRGPAEQTAAGLGQSYRRRGQGRISAVAARRDGAA